MHGNYSSRNITIVDSDETYTTGERRTQSSATYNDAIRWDLQTLWYYTCIIRLRASLLWRVGIVIVYRPIRLSVSVQLSVAFQDNWLMLFAKRFVAS